MSEKNLNFVPNVSRLNSPSFFLPITYKSVVYWKGNFVLLLSLFSKFSPKVGRHWHEIHVAFSSPVRQWELLFAPTEPCWMLLHTRKSICHQFSFPNGTFLMGLFSVLLILFFPGYPPHPPPPSSNNLEFLFPEISTRRVTIFQCFLLQWRKTPTEIFC